MWIQTLVLFIISAPLLSALISGIISSRYSWMVAITGPLLLLGSSVCAVLLFTAVWHETTFQNALPWFSIAGRQLYVGIYLNDLSVIMILIVTTVSFLVHLYSSGYMAGDASLRRYFAMLGFFTFSMLGLVAADNLLLIFFFWELVGFSSYMLIGHWTEKPNTGNASKKAFIVNRIGDIGFLIGILIIWSNTGSLNILYLGDGMQTFSWQTAASLCLLWGAIGKSAQFPLFTWLPDAMAGPTPVSALIHAATMVTAGVFLLARMHFLFTPDVLNAVVIIGMVTALMGGLIALYQYDIKKILAYSTISQLGLMMAAIGTGALEAFTLHLFSHAFFKAGLFLAAGSVIHCMDQALHGANEEFDVQDIRNLGGLKKSLPLTFLVFIVCGAALTGVPLTAGFLSKDMIISNMVAWAMEGLPWRWGIVAAVFITSLLTALYTFRLIWFIFMREGNQNIQKLKLTEAPAVMRIPMILLAVCSLWWIVSANPIHTSGWFYEDKNFSLTLSAAAGLWVSGALAAGYVFYKNKNPEYKASFFSNIFYQAFNLDKFYQQTIVKPIKKIGIYSAASDHQVIDRVIHFAAYTQVTVAHFAGWFDRVFIDGTVHGIAWMARTTGQLTRSFQGGKIQHYIFWSALSIILLLLLVLL